MQSTRAQCSTTQIEVRSGTGADAKYGFTPCPSSDCETKYYRVYSTAEVITYDFTKHDVSGYNGDVHLHEMDTRTGSTQYRGKFDQITCATTVTTNFTCNSMWEKTISGWLWGLCSIRVVDGVAEESECGDDEGWRFFVPSNWTPVSGYQTNACGTVSTIDTYYMESGPFTYYAEATTHPANSYSDEYKTPEMVSHAYVCAENNFASASFVKGTPVASMSTACDNSSASVQKTTWRLRIEGASKGDRFKIIVTSTSRQRNGCASPETISSKVESEEEWEATDALVQYYPSENGQEINVKSGQSCGYLNSKEISVAMVPLDEGGCTTGTCKAGPRKASDNSTLVSMDLGAGVNQPDLGFLAIQSPIGTASLTTPKSVEYHGSGSDLTFIYAGNDIAQVITPRLLVDITTNSATSMTLRAMKIDAQGLWNGATYDWDTNETYLVRQYAIENPDGGSATNRLRVREFSSSFTNEWMYTYTATNSGWNVALPDGSGSIDLVATNHATNAYTLLKRHRDSNGVIIAQSSQIYTNFSWGYSLLQETLGIGADARTKTLTYYTGAPSSAPFTATNDRPPIQSEVEPDGSWRYVLQYTANGLVQTELRGIDSGLTTNTNACLRTEYTYTTQDSMNDTLSREPSMPRKVEEWWKGTLIRRTYHVYSSTYHKVIECPNPSNSINGTGNLITETVYTADTMDVVNVIHPDTTIERVYWTGNTKQVDVGENNGSGYVANGTRTETARSSLGTLTSIKSWDISGGNVGVQTRDSVWSNFDYKERPQQLVEWGSGTSVGTTPLTTTLSYDCCGLSSKTDPDGLITSYVYDPQHRQVGVTRWGITTLKVLDSADRVTQEWRIGTNNSSTLQRGYKYNTAGFLTVQTNALGGTNTFVRSVGGNGFDQILSGNPDGGTNLQSFFGDGRREKTTGNSAAPVRHVYDVATGVSYLGGSRTFAYEQTIKLDSTGTDTSETEKIYFDGLGRIVIRELPGPAQYVSEFNSVGQKIRDIDPDGVWTLYRYDEKGDLIITALDVDHDQYVDDYEASQSGSDRVTTNIHYYVSGTDPGNTRNVDLRVDEQWVWTTASSSTTALVSKIETIPDGQKSWRSIYKDQLPTAVTTTTETAYGSGGSRTLTVTAPNLTKQITTYLYGRPIAITEKDSTTSGVQITKTDIYYDPHGRRLQTVDARNGATGFTYNNADQLLTITTPAPGNGQAPQTTTTGYDVSMRAILVTHPDGRTVTSEYNTMGLLKKRYGARTYPVEYTYDAQGRVRTMKTWQDFVGNANVATTTWSNSPTRGWLIWKHYNDGFGPDYTYSPGGRLQTRTWARTGTNGNRIVTTYSYGLTSGSWHGDQTGITYSSNDPQSTPAVTYTYDRRGRRATVSSSADAITYSYNDANMVTQDTHTAGLLANLNVTWGYNDYLKLTALGANTPTMISQTFTYKNSGLLDVATDGAYDASYSYVPNSKLVSQILYKNNTTTRLTTTKQWDLLNRLAETKSTPAGTGELPSVFDYAYNNANQRVSCSLGDGSIWTYQYDNLGQVISGNRFWADGTPVAGQQFNYAFDDVGNRTSSKAGGDAAGQNMQSVSYTRNLLNQYSQRTVPPVASVLGIANAAANVTVNSGSAYRKGEYFWKELSVANSSVPVWQSLTVQAVNGTNSTTVTGNEYVPKTPEVYSYDLDGNLTQDGRWAYSWDAENRIVRMVAVTTNGPQQRLDFSYDPMGRRIRKQVWNNTTGTGTPAVDIKFLYEGWNLIAELNALSSNANIRTYLWGTDLSGSRQRAGGVGGLLAEKNSAGLAQFIVLDGNGNLTRLVDGNAGTTSATYEYGPFGENIRISGNYATSNPIRWSTKYQDSETELIGYGFRWYNSAIGRWISRDALGERIGNNLYRFVQNHPVSLYDINGLLDNKMVHKLDDLGQRPPVEGVFPDDPEITYGQHDILHWWLDTDVKKKPCCWNVTFHGDLWHTIWWSYPQTREHELGHALITDSYWERLGAAVSPYAKCYPSERQAYCYADLMESLSDYYSTLQAFENASYDCRLEKSRCEEIEELRSLLAQHILFLTEREKQCEQMTK